MSNTHNLTETTQGVESVFHKTRMEVIESYPSIFSKDDVILLIDRIQKDLGSTSQSNVDIKSIEEKVNGVIKDVIKNLEFEGIIELSIDYGNTISIHIDRNTLVSQLTDGLSELFEELEEEKIEG